MAFTIAGSMRSRRRPPADRSAEPVMAVEVVTPRTPGDVIGDLRGARQSPGSEQRATPLQSSFRPAREMFGYATELRSMTQAATTHSSSATRSPRQHREERRATIRDPVGALMSQPRTGVNLAISQVAAGRRSPAEVAQATQA